MFRNVLLTLTVLVFAASNATAVGGPEESIGRLYLEQAVELAGFTAVEPAGKPAQSPAAGQEAAASGDYQTLAGIAEEYLGIVSDILYLRGHRVKREGRLTEAADLWLRAVGLRKWVVLHERDVIPEIGALLLRLKRYETCLEILGPPGEIELEQREHHRLLTEAAYRSGDTALAQQLAGDGLAYFPEDSYYQRLLIRIDPEYRQFLYNGFRSFDSFKDSIARENWLLLISLADNPEIREKMLLHYRSSGAVEPRAELYALPFRPEADGEAVEEILLSLRPLILSDLSLIEEALFTRERQLALNHFLAEYNGPIVEDPNRDGYFETLRFYRQGEIQHAERDGNQDGEAEFWMMFQNSRPVSGGYRDGNREIEVVYSDYPVVRKLEIRDGPFRQQYDLIPERLSMRILSEWEGLVPLQWYKPDFPLTDENLLKAALSRTDYLGEEPQARVVSRWIRETGEDRVKMVRDSDWGKQTMYGGPEGWRESAWDLDHDGFNEMSAQGYPRTRFAIDLDEDGFPEVYLRLENGAYRYFWDLDNDGTIDASSEEGLEP